MSVERALLTAFAERLGACATTAHHAAPWRSATFDGSRHVFTIRPERAADVQAFARDIAEADLVIPRGFVADVAVSPCDDGALTVEVLTIDA